MPVSQTHFLTKQRGLYPTSSDQMAMSTDQKGAGGKGRERMRRSRNYRFSTPK